MKPKDDFTSEYDDALREQSYIEQEYNHRILEEWEIIDSLEKEQQTLNELKDEE